MEHKERYCHRLFRGNSQHVCSEPCTVYCQLSEYGWYWGGVTSSEANKILAEHQDNVFLVRDSYDLRHILCISFRQQDRTMHVRLNHVNGLFSLDNITFVQPNEIAEHCVVVPVEVNGVPLKLSRPLNRFARLNTLQMICRFVIRHMIPDNAWSKLPLPLKLISYVSNGSDYIISMEDRC